MTFKIYKIGNQGVLIMNGKIYVEAEEYEKPIFAEGVDTQEEVTAAPTETKPKKKKETSEKSYTIIDKEKRREMLDRYLAGEKKEDLLKEYGIGKSTFDRYREKMNISTKRKTGICSACGKGGHRKDGCQENKLGGESTDTEGKESITEIQFDDIKLSQEHKMTSVEVADIMDLSIRTVNIAFQVKTFEEFNKR